MAAIDEAAALLLLLAIVEVMPALRPPTELDPAATRWAC